MQNAPAGAANAGGAAEGAGEGVDTLPPHFQLADHEFTEALKSIHEAIQVTSSATLSLKEVYLNAEEKGKEVNSQLERFVNMVNTFDALMSKKVRDVISSVAEHVQKESKGAAQAWVALEEEKTRMAKVITSQEHVVKLNVGGKSFTTSLNTLQREESMLSAMFSGRHALIKDADGAHFIDRSPKWFEKILNYLRDGDCTLPIDANDREELLREASFYQIQGLIAMIDGGARADADLGPLNCRMRDEENHYRGLFVTDRDNPLLTPRVLLINVFESPASLFDPQQDEAALALRHVPVLRFRFQFPPWCPGPATAMPTSRTIMDTFAEFRDAFSNFSDHLLRGLDWRHVLVAGGAVIFNLLTRERREWYKWYCSSGARKDVDIFLYDLDKAGAIKKIIDIYHCIRLNAANRRVLIWRTKHAITFQVEGDNDHSPKIQVILRIYKGPAEVLLGFDLDCVTFGFDGQHVWCLPRGRRSVNSLTNVVDQTRQSQTYEYRLAKYGRRGFRVAVPGLIPSRIDIRLFACKERDLTGLARLLHIWKADLAHITQSFGPLATSDRAERTTKAIFDAEVLAGRKKKVTDLASVVREGMAGESDYDITMGQLCRFSDFRNSAYAMGIFPEEVFDPTLARTFPFAFTIDDIEQVLQPKNPMRVRLWPFDEMHLYHTAITDPVSFITVDPGRQYIGSFHPLDIDWFKDAYEPPIAPSLGAENPTGKDI